MRSSNLNCTKTLFLSGFWFVATFFISSADFFFLLLLLTSSSFLQIDEYIFRPKTLFLHFFALLFLFRKWAFEARFLCIRRKIKSKISRNFQFFFSFFLSSSFHLQFAQSSTVLHTRNTFSRRKLISVILASLESRFFPERITAECNCYENRRKSLALSFTMDFAKIFFHRFNLLCFLLCFCQKNWFSFFLALPVPPDSFSCQFSSRLFIFVSTNENWFFLCVAKFSRLCLRLCFLGGGKKKCGDSLAT